MNEDRQSPPEPGDDGNRIEPLPGEAGIPDVAMRRHTSWSKKGLLAVALLLVSVVGLSAYWLQRLATSGGKSEDPVPQVRDRPAAATTEGRRLEMPAAPRFYGFRQAGEAAFDTALSGSNGCPVRHTAQAMRNSLRARITVASVLLSPRRISAS